MHLEGEWRAMFQPIKRKKVYTEIIEQLKKFIEEGSLKPGDKLMSERELAEKLQVSRSSVREAFLALELMGILESRSGEGTFVSSMHGSNEAIQPLTMMLLMDRGTPKELLELRRILEGEAAFLAAERGSAENLKKIGTNLARMEEDYNNGCLGEESDACFHVALIEAAGNRVLTNLMNRVSDLLVKTMKESREKIFSRPENRDILQQQHRDIYRAIIEKQPEEARAAMHQHIDFVNAEIARLERADLRNPSKLI